MSEPKIHISRAIWDEDTHEVAYIVDGLMFADVATQRKLNAVDDMYEALCAVKQSSLCESCGDDNCDECIIDKALRKARGEAE